MYSIEYKIDKEDNSGIYKNIESLTIDRDDIMMMQYVDILYNGDKNLVLLYLKYLKHCHLKGKEYSKYTIKNDSVANGKIIASIIQCNWLINEKSIRLNREEYLKRKELFQEEMELLSKSHKTHDIHESLLRKYYIDTLDKNLENEKQKVK